jgi:hypothetical protein
MNNKTPLSFEEWKGNVAPKYSDELLKSMKRLHDIDYNQQFEDTLKLEYQNYLDDFNGNWLLK